MKRKLMAGCFVLMFFSFAFCGNAAEAPAIAQEKEGPAIDKAPGAIDDGKKVKMHYVMKVDGKVVDDTHQKGPFEFVYGDKAPLIPGLQKGLKGLKTGEHKTLVVPPEEAFGKTNDKALLEVPKAKLPVQEVQVGMVFTLPGQEGGEPAQGVVKELKKDTAVLDFNHPLAGKAVQFDVEILEVV